jgi:tRNA threonylcarbamoyladenosine biosynthesis protein TsaB
MLILGVDTSGPNGSIALVRFGTGSPQVLEVVPIEGGTFSAQLVPQISGLLAEHGLTKQGIDGFAVVSGPGSFTGLRVGLAAIKGLAEILQKPIAAISRLEAIALTAGNQGNFTAALDAGRGEIYLGEYQVDGTRASVIAQELLSTSEFVERVRDTTVVTPDTKITEFAATWNISILRIEPPRADTIAGPGFEKIQGGETVSPENLDANYIRRSDAEIAKAK